DGVPGVQALHNGEYAPRPHWYRGFQYDAERERGLDCEEDLAAPGLLRFDLARGDAGEAVLILSACDRPVEATGNAGGTREVRVDDGSDAVTILARLRH